MKRLPCSLIAISIITISLFMGCSDCDDCEPHLENYHFNYKNAGSNRVKLIALSFQGDTVRLFDLLPGDSAGYSVNNREGPAPFYDSRTKSAILYWPQAGKCESYLYKPGGCGGPIFCSNFYQRLQIGNRTYRYTYLITQQALDTAQVCL